MATINKAKAKQILLKSLKDSKLQEDTLGKNITTILTGTHKTFRYMLVTALLSKASDENIDILSIQANDSSSGSYDARSICHSILVPFEREYLFGCLGNSNEPYLNKPARFPRISIDNAARSGNDKKLQQLLVDTLSSITTSQSAYKYLCSALADMITIYENIQNKYEFTELEEHDSHIQDILNYVFRLINKSCSGEICPLIVAALEKLSLPNRCIIQPHKVNESGASSKEVGDIDIYSDDQLIISIEVKDKNFTKEDVQHAITKASKNGLKRSLFIYGKNVSFDEKQVFQLLARMGRTGHYCCIISIKEYSKYKILSIKDVKLNDFVNILLSFAKDINCHEDTITWIKESAITE